MSTPHPSMNVDAYLAALDVEHAARAVKQAIRDGRTGEAEAYARTVERRLHRLRNELEWRVDGDGQQAAA